MKIVKRMKKLSRHNKILIRSLACYFNGVYQGQALIYRVQEEAPEFTIAQIQKELKKGRFI